MKLYQRDPIYRCWRVAAIHRCVMRYGKDLDWALEKVREIAPDGAKDALVEDWFVDIDQLRQPAEPVYDGMELMAA